MNQLNLWSWQQKKWQWCTWYFCYICSPWSLHYSLTQTQSGRGCVGPHWCHLVWFLQSVSSMAFLYCCQPRLGYLWKICMTSHLVALPNVCLCTPMALCGLSVLPCVLHTRAQKC
jgi:hypothetical protein